MPPQAKRERTEDTATHESYLKEMKTDFAFGEGAYYCTYLSA